MEAMAAHLEDQMFAGFGALCVARSEKEEVGQSQIPVLIPFPLIIFAGHTLQPQLPGHQ